MEKIAAIRELLGGKKVIGSLPTSEFDFVPVIRRGVLSTALSAIRDKSQLTEEVIYDSLRIARRTAQRRKSQSDRLKPAESELLLRLAQVLATAADVLGDLDQARDWILRENRALGGECPIRLLDTGYGFQEVLNLLGRIEHGVHS